MDNKNQNNLKKRQIRKLIWDVYKEEHLVIGWCKYVSKEGVLLFVLNPTIKNIFEKKT